MIVMIVGLLLAFLPHVPPALFPLFGNLSVQIGTRVLVVHPYYLWPIVDLNSRQGKAPRFESLGCGCLKSSWGPYMG